MFLKLVGWDIFNASKDSVAWYYTSILDAFGNGHEGISDMPAYKEFGKCVGEMFWDGGESGCGECIKCAGFNESFPQIKDGVATGKYSTNQKLVSMGLALRSLYLVSQYVPLSDEEAQATAYHDGMYVPEGRSVSHREELLLLHWADMWTAKMSEEKMPKNK